MSIAPVHVVLYGMKGGKPACSGANLLMWPGNRLAYLSHYPAIQVHVYRYMYTNLIPRPIGLLGYEVTYKKAYMYQCR
jgi:hypothetical protein